MGRVYGGSLVEAAPEAQVMVLAARWREPLSQGAPEVRLQAAAVRKRSVWRRQTAAVAGEGHGAEECAICLEAAEAGGVRLRCGHGFCGECWRRHLIAEVRRGRLSLRCAAHACDTAVDLATALCFVSLAVLEQHRRLVLLAALEEGGRTAFCPNAQCRRPVRLRGAWSEDADARTVRCLCGHVFCFACEAEGHWPAPCAAFDAYRTAVRSLGVWRASHEGAAMLRTMVRGQRCPKCRRFSEKIDGCNDMTCSCKTHFCYLCGIEQSKHSHYYPCTGGSQRYFTRAIFRLKTRFTAERVQPSRAALEGCPALFRQALELRQRRQDVLSSGFRFRRRFGPALARLLGARSCYRLEEDSGSGLGWRALFAGLEDVMRGAEFALVARSSEQLSSAARRRLQKRGLHLCRLQKEMLGGLESGQAGAAELQALLREGRETLRAMHGPEE